MNPKTLLIAALTLVAIGCKSKSDSTITFDTATSMPNASSGATQSAPVPQPGQILQQQQGNPQLGQPQGMGQAGQPPQTQVGTKMDPAVAAKMPEMPKSTPSPEQYPTDPPVIPPPSSWKRHGDTVVTPTGLKWIDLKPGEGNTPIAGDFVTVSYIGMLTDGKEFDRSTSFTTEIGKGTVIPGWDEGVISMKKGGKRRLIIPSKLGARAVSKGDAIPPNRTLVYDIDMMLIQK